MVLIGSACHYDTRITVRYAAAEFARARLCLINLFVGGRHSGETALAEAKAIFPGVPIVGGSVAGIITRDAAAYSGFEIALVGFSELEVAPFVFASDPTIEDDFEKARDLGSRIQRESGDGSCLVLFYDSVRKSVPRQLHFGSSIARGIVAGLGSSRSTLVGAGLLTNFNLDASWVYDGSAMRTHCIVAQVFPPTVCLKSAVLPGSRPTDVRMRITKIEGAEVVELDGRPAFAVLCEILGRNPAALNNVLALNVSLGQTSPYAADSCSGHVANRLILGEDRVRQSVTLFEPDFHEGEEVQILIQDSKYMIREIEKLIEIETLDRVTHAPTVCYYFNCAGRSSILSGSAQEDGLALLGGLPRDWPTIGIYSGVEIAQVGGHARSLDLTGVLAKFTMR